MFAPLRRDADRRQHNGAFTTTRERRKSPMQRSDDRTQATLAINKTLTAPDIENLIRELAMLRSQMTPEVTPAPQDSNGSGVPDVAGQPHPRHPVPAGRRARHRVPAQNRPGLDRMAAASRHPAGIG